MSGSRFIEQLRRLCRDLDEGRPLRRLSGAGRAVGALLVPLAMGAAGCGHEDGTRADPVPDQVAAPRALVAEEDRDGASPEASPAASIGSLGVGGAYGAPFAAPGDAGGELPDGTIGHGSGIGNASGLYGAPFPGRPLSVPTLRLGEVVTEGGMEPGIARRYVRRSIVQLRYCYEQQLGRAPTLAGDVTVRFTVSAEGRVTEAATSDSTLRDEAVEQCLVQAVRRMAFPPVSGGGQAVVRLPLSFRPEDEPAGEPSR